LRNPAAGTLGNLAASTSQMEILLFSLGTREIFGINVFKVREVSQVPKITKTPNTPAWVKGVLSLRGSIIPVISLAHFAGTRAAEGSKFETMIVTEFNRSTLAFLVESVDRIIRVDWEKVRTPENMSGAKGEQSLITAITELDDGRLVSILDVEQVLASVVGETKIPDLQATQMAPDQYVFFADDSMMARKEITGVLEKMGVKFQQANNGKEAWERLRLLAGRKFEDGEALRDRLRLILVDAEMPEMDGYTLTKLIKGDNRFAGIPVIMHSSLSSAASRAHGSAAGVDGYVAKFDPVVLAETLMPYLQD
jgi:two-component system chemotaxis response regulator CheV